MQTDTVLLRGVTFVSCLGQLMARTLFPVHVTASHGLRVWSWHELAA